MNPGGVRKGGSAGKPQDFPVLELLSEDSPLSLEVPGSLIPGVSERLCSPRALGAAAAAAARDGVDVPGCAHWRVLVFREEAALRAGLLSQARRAGQGLSFWRLGAASGALLSLRLSPRLEEL